MTRSDQRSVDRAIRQHMKDHPGTSLNAARRAVEHPLPSDTAPQRLPSVPAPAPGQALESWVAQVAAHLKVGRHQAMEALGLEPGTSAQRLRDLSTGLPQRTLDRLRAATGLTEGDARALVDGPVAAAPVDALSVQDVVALVRARLEGAREQARAQGLPESSAWAIAFTEPEVTRFGGVQALQAAARTAARQARISVRTTRYRRIGDPQQMLTVSNQGPYKTGRPLVEESGPWQPFTLDPAAGPVDDGCPAAHTYCLAGARRGYRYDSLPEEVWNSLRPDTDLRTVPEEYRRHFAMDDCFAPDRTDDNFRNQVLDLDLFFDGATLGPLAEVQVYATNARGRLRGCSHGATCRYADPQERGYGPLPSQRHEILTLAELVEILRPLHTEQARHPGSLMRDRDLEERWCTWCRGYSVRLLTPSQCAHYRTERSAWFDRAFSQSRSQTPEV
jgi:hypothetical protein